MRIMGILGATTLMKIIMGSNTPPRIITIPITPIRTATTTILTRKAMGAGKDTKASNLMGLANISEAQVATATAVVAMAGAMAAAGAGTEVRRLAEPRSLHPPSPRGEQRDPEQLSSGTASRAWKD